MSDNGDLRNIFTLLVLLAAPTALWGQSAVLTGHVTDESGAVVPKAVVSVNGPGGLRAVESGTTGEYALSGLTAGSYKVSAAAPQMSMAAPIAINLRQGPNALDLRLRITANAQQVTVTDNAGPALSTEASANASATVMKGDDLDALSDDPADLQADLEALAGPGAGPDGPSIFVDGFSGGELPPKESIREIRINSNPFSPEYDKIGFGRIEIFTKPGSDRYHASLGYNLGTQKWNSRNPYSAKKAPFLLQETENSMSGPLGAKASFTMDLEYQAVDNGSITNAVTLDSALIPVPFSTSIVAEQRRLLLGPHVDYQLSQNNTLSLRYTFSNAEVTDAGTGSFDLTSRAYDSTHGHQTAQIMNTFVHGTMVNETRFQYFRSTGGQTANSNAPSILVSGSFNAGGSPVGHSSDVRNNFELQNYTTMVRGRHYWRFGTRLRGVTEENVSQSNFNGSFSFAGGLAPANLDGTGPMQQISSIEQYRRTLILIQQGLPAARSRALGGGASQFSIGAGTAGITGSQVDGGLFVGDDWKLRPNLTVNIGLRYEFQNNIHDRRDVAPRFALAWAPGSTAKKQGKTVVRGGIGLFYDRFLLGNTLAAERADGVIQQRFVVTNPDFFPTVPSLATLAANKSVQSIQMIDSSVRAPYLIQSAVSVERQLPRDTTLAVTYTNSHGLHIGRSEYLPGARGPIYLLTTSGLYNQNQVSTNVNTKLSPALSLMGSYTLSKVRSNSDGFGTYPANPKDFDGEYGPAANDVRHRGTLSGTIFLRYGWRLNPLLTLQSGAPFNITTGQDFYGTTLYNSRPGIATDPTRVGVVKTPYGLLDPNPTAGETILARNSGRGPGMVGFNLRVGKSWVFGPEKAGAKPFHKAEGWQILEPTDNSRKFKLTASMSIRNILNHNNPGQIIGNIASPLFGRSNSAYGGNNNQDFSEAANNRRLELQLRLGF